MTRSLVLVLSVLQASATLPDALDVTTLRLGAPITVVELDVGRLKGDLRQLSWSPDGRRFYLQTAEGNRATATLRHYWVAIEGGAVLGLDAQPEWAQEYWAFKSDRLAPGMESVMIEVEQKIENLKFGTGSAGAADRSSDALGAGNINSASNVEKAAESQRVKVVRLTVYGQVVGEFRNAAPLPGLTFSWGPERSGLIAYTDADGRLSLVDAGRRRSSVPGVRNALLPAWSVKGDRIAWVERSGRRKFVLRYADVTR